MYIDFFPSIRFLISLFSTFGYSFCKVLSPVGLPLTSSPCTFYFGTSWWDVYMVLPTLMFLTVLVHNHFYTPIILRMATTLIWLNLLTEIDDFNLYVCKILGIKVSFHMSWRVYKVVFWTCRYKSYQISFIGFVFYKVYVSLLI